MPEPRTVTASDIASLRRRNARTGWVLLMLALGIALSVWYARVA
jgi:hypothetical protein